MGQESRSNQSYLSTIGAMHVPWLIKLHPGIDKFEPSWIICYLWNKRYFEVDFDQIYHIEINSHASVVSYHLRWRMVSLKTIEVKRPRKTLIYLPHYNQLKSSQHSVVCVKFHIGLLTKSIFRPVVFMETKRQRLS